MEPILDTQLNTSSQPVKDISADYDTILKTELTKRLNRPPSVSELTNADNDSDVVNETLWQLICKLDARIAALENKQIL